MEKNNKKVVIINYKLSNLFSVEHACRHFGVEPIITDNKNEIPNADAIILPGVGAFADAMNNLQKMDLIQPIRDYVQTGKPFLGICLGLQLLFTESEEFGTTQGLNIIQGQILKFPTTNNNRPIKVPQTGWNTIYHPNQPTRWQNTPLHNIQNNEYMYFVHSYYASPANPDDTITLTNYEEIQYTSAIQHKNIFATQYHPEKSATKGLQIYQNWLQSIK